MLQSTVSHYPPSRFAVSRASLRRPAYQVAIPCSDSFGSESLVEQNKDNFFFLFVFNARQFLKTSPAFLELFYVQASSKKI